MAFHHTHLPQLAGQLFLTDGGLETTLIFREGFTLPEFAAFTLLSYEAGYQALRAYFQTYARLANTYQVGLILESATWRANPDWGAKLGYAPKILAEMNTQAIQLLREIQAEYQTVHTPIVVSGNLGPRGDGYVPTTAMTAEQAQTYHQFQIATLQGAGAELITAMTINYVEEAIGIVRAAQAVGMPVVIAFTVETDGRLPTGQSLQAAIEAVDVATGQGPLYYMINCAHPTHFAGILAPGAPWVERIRGLRANASTMSHAEHNESETLDDGNPQELGDLYRELQASFPHITILGGCCGTDDRHVEAICRACLPVGWAALTNPLHQVRQSLGV
ncbi:MAG: homocysteine S-methyltransferase family protein [Gloeomargaritaceae cyanobacterium C42_A2020_066]|nr:homocysteine S-methyltransferase family protein [Gloeomargaritaceae cyanobacterium C42_A2020_066]